MILDKASQLLAQRKFDEAVAKFAESDRVLSEAEAAGVMAKCVQWALSVKKKAATVEEKELVDGVRLAEALDDALSDFKVNPNYIRMALAAVGKALGYNVHQTGTRGENAGELIINLDDDLASELDSLLGEEDDSDLLMEFLTAKDTRTRDVTKGIAARPKVEDDPVFRAIKAAIPGLIETVNGEVAEGLDAGRVAVKAFKHCVKELNGMAYTKLKIEG